MRPAARVVVPAGLITAVAIGAAYYAAEGDRGRTSEPAVAFDPPSDSRPVDPRTLQLAFAGDVHFEGDLDEVAADPEATLGRMSEVFDDADVAMVNLESAITERGRRAGKDLEDEDNRYWFRTEDAALEVLRRSGIDVVTMANNHGADFGVRGVTDTIRAGERSDVAMVGIGRNERAAFAPHRTRVKGVDIAIHGADASALESDAAIWTAEPGTGPGLASARGSDSALLEAAVEASAGSDDLVVVYLHWGEEGESCPSPDQTTLAERLGEAGADIVVGAHTHMPQGAGMAGSTYVSYGLGNFFWYHGRESDSGVLRLSVRDGELIGDEWIPAEIPERGGAPVPLSGDDRAEAVAGWDELRSCTDLTPGPGPVHIAEEAPPSEPPDDDDAVPEFISRIERLDDSVLSEMPSHDEDACPLAASDLRLLTLSYVGFDGRSHRGELVVDESIAEDVVDVFAALYEDRFPIESMRLIDDFDGDDDRSMAANNTSAYNCRTVAGQTRWSDHAFGRAVDINPVQNPYVVDGEARPEAAAEFTDVDREPGAEPHAGVISIDDVVHREFTLRGWNWGGDYSEPDYQHFSAPNTLLP